MPFSIRPHRRFPVQCTVMYNAGPFQGQGTIWNLSCTGWRLSGDLPMRPWETLSLTVTLPNYQTIPWALIGTLAVGEEPARAGCAFSPLIRAATLAAMSRNAAARDEAGSLITTGSP
jgi:hypothetical protein